MGAMTCVAPCNAVGSPMSASTFESYYGQFAQWASGATGMPVALILTQWFEESNKGTENICATSYPYGHNNPANYNNLEVFSDICTGVNDAYILAMTSTSGTYAFPVNASDGNGRTAAQYIMDAYNAGQFQIPPSNRYGPLPGAGTVVKGAFEAACAAMGSMGWATSNYYTSGDAPTTPGNILMNWYNTYFSSLVSTSDFGTNTVPGCCGWPSPT